MFLATQNQSSWLIVSNVDGAGGLGTPPARFSQFLSKGFEMDGQNHIDFSSGSPRIVDDATGKSTAGIVPPKRETSPTHNAAFGDKNELKSQRRLLGQTETRNPLLD